MAAPVAGQILSEVLPYLEVEKNEENMQIVTVPNIVGMTEVEAKKTLEESGLILELKDELEENGVIGYQLPKEGIKIKQGTNVIAYK